MGKMSKEEKLDMMGVMMEKFFADLTVEDRQGMMEQMMPRMMEGINMMEIMPKMMMHMMGGNGGEGGMMSMMSGMMGGSEAESMPMMPHMMTQMMPKCLEMMLPSLPKEERGDFAIRMVATLVDRGSQGMTDEERKSFVAAMEEKIKA